MLEPELTCQWLVAERRVGEYVTPETEEEIKYSFCLIQDFFTNCSGRCKDYCPIGNDKHHS